MITCKVKGHMKQKRFSLCTGDRVQLEVNPDKADEGMITAVLPRRNYLDRPTVANQTLQRKNRGKPLLRCIGRSGMKPL